MEKYQYLVPKKKWWQFLSGIRGFAWNKIICKVCLCERLFFCYWIKLDKEMRTDYNKLPHTKIQRNLICLYCLELKTIIRRVAQYNRIGRLRYSINFFRPHNVDSLNKHNSLISLVQDNQIAWSVWVCVLRPQARDVAIGRRKNNVRDNNCYVVAFSERFTNDKRRKIPWKSVYYLIFRGHESNFSTAVMMYIIFIHRIHSIKCPEKSTCQTFCCVGMGVLYVRRLKL